MKAFYIKQLDDTGDHLQLVSEEIPDKFEQSYIDLIKDDGMMEDIYLNWKKENKL